MSDVIELDLDLPGEPTDGDNITDWCLEQFHARYGDHITKDDIWEYLYGVMHAPTGLNATNTTFNAICPGFPSLMTLRRFESRVERLWTCTSTTKRSTSTRWSVSWTTK